ncbi:MAG: DUF3857 domain-containing protein [Bacteroidota bacterium]
MRKRISLIFIAFFGTFTGFSQEPLNVNLIADSLTAGSDAVVRYYSTTYERKSLEVYNKQVHYVVTVLNAQGKHAARLSIRYDRNSEVTEIKGTVYNADGNVHGQIKKKDIKDYASNASYTLFSDNRVKSISPLQSGYPYTVEYRYTVKHKGMVGFDTWMPLKGFDLSTERAELVVKTPAALALRYMALNHDFDFEADTSEPGHTLKWSAANLKAIESEPGLPHYLDYMPVVLLSPNDISYEGTSGSFRTWNDYGKWVYSLIEERDLLPDETVIKMKGLTDTIPGQLEKVKAVYQYMQGKTRYVNVALGIGGFQPLHAYEVDEKGYGDCKALSNYTRALLKSVGIESYYAEIGNGRSRELKYPDFASINQTNHIILCVPVDGDTVWLECTSQTAPFGYIGTGNSNRYALLISEKGGVLARTPVYRSAENVRTSRSNIDIEENGDALYEVTTDFVNAEFGDVSGILQLSQKEQRDALLKYLSLEGFTMEKFSMLETTSELPEARFSLRGKVSRFATKSGKRLFFRPEYIFSQTSFNTISKERDLNLYKPIGYHHVDTVFIAMPENFHIERLPEDVSLESDFGSYSLSIIHNDTGIQMTRNLEIHSGNYCSSQFTSINSFTEAISRSDDRRIVICQ